MIVLPGGIVREGLLSGSAAAFGGLARTDPEGGSGGRADPAVDRQTPLAGTTS